MTRRLGRRHQARSHRRDPVDGGPLRLAVDVLLDPVADAEVETDTDHGEDDQGQHPHGQGEATLDRARTWQPVPSEPQGESCSLYPGKREENKRNAISLHIQRALPPITKMHTEAKTIYYRSLVRCLPSGRRAGHRGALRSTSAQVTAMRPAALEPPSPAASRRRAAPAPVHGRTISIQGLIVIPPVMAGGGRVRHGMANTSPAS